MSVTLTHQQERAIEHLLDGKTPAEAARELGVDRKTVWRWTQLPDFDREVRRLRAKRRAEAHSELDAGTRDAVALLRRVIVNEAEDTKTRLHAATALLDRAGIGPASRVEIEQQDDRDPVERLDGLLGRLGMKVPPADVDAAEATD